MRQKTWNAIRKMVCNYYECSDSNDKIFPVCEIKNSYSRCPFNKVEYIIVTALLMAEKMTKENEEH